MTAIHASLQGSHATIGAVPTKGHAVAESPARTPIRSLTAALNTTATEPSRRRGGESIEAGPREHDAIHHRMAVAESARTQLWQWIHPVTGTPFARRAEHLDPVPDALDAAPSGEAYVRGRGSVVCVRVDELVRSRDCADFPTTNTNRIS
jgi:hypothetical protein